MNGPALACEIEMRAIASLQPYANNARTHSRKQIKQIADSIERFGFTNPVLISDSGDIIAGHGRVAAAKSLGLDAVPTIRLSHLSEAERRAYVLADNKLALNAGWDDDILAIELQGLIDLEFDVTLTGFSVAEVDLVIDGANERNSDPDTGSPADRLPALPEHAVSRSGDLWELGGHRLLCGDARDQADYELLLSGDVVDLVFTDPPYNVPIDGHVCGLGSVRHESFAFASGEMTAREFTSFLTSTLSNCGAVCRNGAIAFVCMDWRHMRELLDAGENAFTELKNLCVWNKTNGGMGTFYRSKHELIFRVQSGRRTAHQHLLARRNRALSHQCVGLCRHQQFRRHAPGRVGNASDRQTGRPCRRRHQGLFKTRRTCSRCVWWLRHNPSRCGDLRQARPSPGVRSSLLRHNDLALAGLHGQTRNSRLHRRDIRRHY